jgi:regulator of ribonuclease activity A
MLLTTDLSDNFRNDVKAADSIFKDYGGQKQFHGEIITIKLFEDNSLVRKILEENGQGKVLVVDGGGSKRCALLGDQLGELAVKNKWNGLVIYGCVRDSVALSKLPIGIKALGTHPFKTEKRNEGQIDLTLTFSGVDFIPSHYLYADEDGILVSHKKLH